MLETSGPVPAFTDAVQARDVNRMAGLLAHDVRLSVPPLHYTRRGTQDVIGALVGLLRSFDDLQYDVRSRYVAPGTVTDEALLLGRQTASFLGTEPGREPSAVAARVIVAHDAATITAITVWPDLAALRTAVGGTCRMIDLTKVGDAGVMVARLRATMPPTQAKLIIGSAREEPPPAAPALPEVAVPVADAGPLAGRTVPKPPVPRTVRRRRTFLAGSSMLVVSSALTLWVAVGALNHADGGPSTRPGEPRTSSAGATGAPGSGTQLGVGADAGTGSGSGAGGGGARAAGRGGDTAASDGAAKDGAATDGAATDGASTLADSAPTRLTVNRTEVRFRSDVLFDLNSARLKPVARSLLDTLIAAARDQDRQGLVTVSGYTDDRGSGPYNQKLSLRRATAVADYLGKELAGTRMRFTPRGYGSAHPVVPNDTDADRALNRRVQITFPRASAAAVARVTPHLAGAGA